MEFITEFLPLIMFAVVFALLLLGFPVAFTIGGLAVSVIFVGALMGASTGIVGATVVTMGLLSVPTMLRNGYNKSLTTGIRSNHPPSQGVFLISQRYFLNCLFNHLPGYLPEYLKDDRIKPKKINIPPDK
jgi:hypothetical protein